MALWDIGLHIAKRLWIITMHNNKYQIYFANGDSRLKMLRQVFAFGAWRQYFTDLKDYPTEQAKMALLIAQWLNVPFQNTNLEVYRRHAGIFKEAVAENAPLPVSPCVSTNQESAIPSVCVCV